MLGGCAYMEEGLEVLPFSIKPLQLGAPQHEAAFIGDRCSNRLWSSAPHIRREPIGSAALHANSAKAGVVEGVTRLVDTSPQVVRVRRVEWIFRVNAKFALGTIKTFFAKAQHLVPSRQRLLKLKGPVLHQFRIESTV